VVSAYRVAADDGELKDGWTSATLQACHLRLALPKPERRKKKIAEFQFALDALRRGARFMLNEACTTQSVSR
jgi:hypothetical protein